MPLGEFVAWAWRETPPVHTRRANLLIHLFAVPLFVWGHVLVLVGIALGPWIAVAGVACILASVIAQKIGHSLDSPVHPFLGAFDFFRRLYVEQFWNFWRFLFTGGWLAAFRAGR